MSTWTNTLFYLTFLSQIFLISYYFPAKVLGRMNYVLKTYPPSKYPKLYPKPLEYYMIGRWGFKLATRIIFVLGFAILLAVIFLVDHSTFSDDGYISEFWPALYGVIQFAPLMVLDFTEFSQFRLMRKANTVTKRTAALRPRRLFDFVSPMLVAMAALLYVTVILFDLYVHDFIFDWSDDWLQRAAVITATNLFLGGAGVWHLYARKQNPHQTLNDRNKQIGVALKSLFYVSMAMSVFFIAAVADDVIDMHFLDATLMSFYFQAITFLSLGHALRKLRLEDINFDVYKNGVTAEANLSVPR